jgi:thiamine kinase-like enzyme
MSLYKNLKIIKSLKIRPKIDDIKLCSYAMNPIAFLHGEDGNKYVLKIIEKDWRRENERCLRSRKEDFKTFKFLPIVESKEEFYLYKFIYGRGYFSYIQKNQDKCLNIISNIIDELDGYVYGNNAKYFHYDHNKPQLTIDKIEELEPILPFVLKYKKYMIDLDLNTLENYQLVHGDFRLANMIFSEEDETFLFDWEYSSHSDKNLDYASMYVSICYHCIDLADKFYDMIKTKKFFNKDKFIYYSIKEHIVYLHKSPYPKSEILLIKALKKIDDIL